MAVLSKEQVDAFWRDGYLVVSDAVTPAQLAQQEQLVQQELQDFLY